MFLALASCIGANPRGRHFLSSYAFAPAHTRARSVDSRLRSTLGLTSSDLHAEDCDNTDVGGLSQLNWDQTVGLRVPKGRRSWCDSCAIVLLDNARDYILELLVEPGELFDTLFNNLLGPLVYLVTLVLNLVGTNDVVDRLFSDALHILGIELVLVVKLCHNYQI